MRSLSAAMSPRRFRKLHRLLAHVTARLNRKRHKPECSMIRNIVPEPRPLGPFSPRRSPPSCLGSLSSVRLRRRVRNHDIHCRKPKLRQHRHDVAPALAFDHALLAGHGPVARLRRRLAADDWQQRRPGARHLPGYRGASGSSWLPSRRPSHDLLRQQRLLCICTAGGPRQRQRGAPGGATQRQRTCRCQVSCGRPGWRSARPQRALRTSYGAWQRRAAHGWCRGRSWTACQHGMRHLPSSSRAAAPQAARSCCPGTPSAGPSLLRPICTAPRAVREGCTTAPAQRAKRSRAPLQVALCLASASHERCVRGFV